MRHQDLNLLIIFDAIMTEGAITRAADRLAMTQPAVSNALSRMRSAWNDELFVKDGRGIQPTNFARNLWGQVRGPLGQLEDAIAPSAFDAATATRTFRIAAADITVEAIWGRLRHEIEKSAPGVNLFTIPNNFIDQEDLLNNAEVDLIVGKSTSNVETIRSEYLTSPKFVCVMRHDHPLAKRDELSLEDFIQAEHLLVTLSGQLNNLTDQALNNIGMSRRIAMSVNHFSAVSSLLKQSNLICVVPSMAVEQEIFSDELAVYEVPIEHAPSHVSLMWHKRQENDQGLTWLRQLIARIMRERADQHFNALAKCCRKGYCPEQVKRLVQQNVVAIS
ncbi:LysR family transcriptional regulator [Alteromonas sp. KUL49]|uniref:LysR family transcriptional regulator n=1 Tax=Alteromonas sp. KUL49 TaxID=2480798 RepID=UPI00102EED40|nr:LysR family transcriptional regulator [Alteromonas sp. KUL49]TAP38969.1 LysR family transcriptional regulator [Alteromonas sp. KUL49]GEA12411.1 LysR family transcriptional regulator [Alteromonas sp. KUL49]